MLPVPSQEPQALDLARSCGDCGVRRPNVVWAGSDGAIPSVCCPAAGMGGGPATWRSPARRTSGRATSIVGALIERRERWLPPVLLACVTLVSFLPTLENGFVGDWD